jgi:hypothetical protein
MIKKTETEVHLLSRVQNIEPVCLGNGRVISIRGRMINEDDTSIPQWRIRHRVTCEEVVITLFAYWEVEGDSIGDHTPALISAPDLFLEWVRNRTGSRGSFPSVDASRLRACSNSCCFSTHVLGKPPGVKRSSHEVLSLTLNVG